MDSCDEDGESTSSNNMPSIITTSVAGASKTPSDISMASFEKLVLENKTLKDKIEQAQAVPMEFHTHVADQIRREVRHGLFHYLKFVLTDADLNDCGSARSAGGSIMKALMIPEDKAHRFWKTYKHVVRPSLNQQRNNVTSMLKREFIGEIVQ